MMRIANDTEPTVDTSQAATHDEDAVISHIDNRKLTKKKSNESMVGKMWQLKKEKNSHVHQQLKARPSIVHWNHKLSLRVVTVTCF